MEGEGDENDAVGKWYEEEREKTSCVIVVDLWWDLRKFSTNLLFLF